MSMHKFGFLTKSEIINLNELQAKVESMSHDMTLLRRFLSSLVQNPSPSGDHKILVPRVLVANWLGQARARAKYMPDTILRDLGWIILLDLFVHGEEGQRVSVSSACIASGGPPTTALRWLSILENEGLVVRNRDDRDGRRIYVELTSLAREAVVRWAGELT